MKTIKSLLLRGKKANPNIPGGTGPVDTCPSNLQTGGRVLRTRLAHLPSPFISQDICFHCLGQTCLTLAPDWLAQYHPSSASPSALLRYSAPIIQL